MPSVVLALIFTPLVLLCAWSILRAIHSGEIRDEIWSFQADTSPSGFAIAIAGRGLVMAFGVAEVLYAFGLSENPIVLFKSALENVL